MNETQSRSVAPAVRLDVSVIIPCYNEEEAIGPTLEELNRVLRAAEISFEVIVVDDGSSDGTALVLNSAVAPVRLLRNAQNRGYGAALKRGIHHAGADLIAIMDADGTYPPKEIPALLRAVQNNDCDMAVAARTGANVSVPLVRRPPKWILGKFATFVAGHKIPDMNSGLRVFPRSAAERMLGILPDGFSFTTTITLAMLTNGYEVSFQPIDYLSRIGTSKIRPVRDTLNFIQLIIKMALYFAPLRIFIPLSLVLLALSVVWAAFSLTVLGRLADVSTLILAVAALQIAAIGLLAEMIRWRLPPLNKSALDK